MLKATLPYRVHLAIFPRIVNTNFLDMRLLPHWSRAAGVFDITRVINVQFYRVQNLQNEG